MRVLHIGKYFPPAPGGMESYLGELVSALEKEGVTSYVLAHRWDSSEPAVTQISANVTVERVPTYGQVCYVPVAPAFVFYLIRAIRKFKPDCIHIHMPNASGLWNILTSFSLPIVIHWHADTTFPPEKKLHNTLYAFYRPFENMLLRKARSIIATSEKYAQYSQSLSAYQHKCHIIPLGINPNMLPTPSNTEIESLRKTYCNNDETLIISVGRFSYYKGFHNLVEAMKQVQSGRLVIVGDGEEFNNISQQIEACRLESNVTLAGRLSTQELHTLFAAADIFCLPSIERTEAFGMVLLEAMHHSTPCISTDLKGSATGWVNEHMNSGLVVPPNNVSELTNAINSLIHDTTLRAELGENANKRLLANFQISTTAKQIAELYKNSLLPPS
ncbi:glycosyltransferase [Halodesulfovibrio sp. MK-HDV]|uniref:glycosyltransferase n=1 Tax=Halodesulfovibrio sp. MK-HDV TaxID=2599925 RepID=UPI00136BB1F2|nr:glycosyltransferase [Halodesulfovibrio sp. MK-HDV]KAF1075620.1 Alpha-D-kanosaminyltransferase [Halodesulfovibrio sp. MK-HDV]